jgi:hypothetical protein
MSMRNMELLAHWGSIGRDNRDSVVVFARYGDLVGWKYIVITHIGRWT